MGASGDCKPTNAEMWTLNEGTNDSSSSYYFGGFFNIIVTRP